MLELGFSIHPQVELNWSQIFDLAVELGAEIVEVNLDHPELLTLHNPRNLAQKLKEFATNYSVNLGIQAPQVDVNPASLNTYARTAAEKVLNTALTFAIDCGARYFVVHLGTFYRSIYNRRYYTRALTQALKLLSYLFRFVLS